MHAYENTRSGLCLWYLYTHLVASESSQSDDTQTRPSQELAPTTIRKITNIIILQSKYTIMMIIFITEWSTQATPVVVTPCTELAGPRVPLPHDPLGIFSLFFNDNLVGMIVEETNRYAEQCLQETDKQWSTNAEEIRAYLGFMILMGINRLPEIRDYWSTDENLRYAPIADRISRDRFEEITRYLHFADNDQLPARGEDGFSRLQKVDPVISILKQRFKAVYYPHSQLSVDEAMIPFKGRSSMKQYLPMKPVKRGFKVWAMADALNGYLYDFNVYTGATGERETALGEKVVLTLSEPLRGKHHQLFFDNYFTSTLLDKLLARGTYGCGTIRTNRKNFPSEISEEAKKFERGGSVFRQCGKIVATAWKDNRVVNVGNTLADPTQLTTVKRRQKDGTRIDVDCPLCIALNNEYMGGVDHNDHLRGSYHVRWKCMKNYKYVFCFLLDVSITNGFILHSFDVRSGPPMDQKHFRLRLAEQLIGTYMSRKRAGRPRKRPRPPSSSSIPTEHFPTHSTKRRCVYCRDIRSQPRRKESVWVCMACEGEPTLCMTGTNDENDCFRLWHQQ